MALDEGKMGTKDSDRPAGQYRMKKVGGDEPQLARKQAIEAARKAGILGTAAKEHGGKFASLTGTGDFTSGLDDKDVYGGLLGDEAGAMHGGLGFGRGDLTRSWPLAGVDLGARGDSSVTRDGPLVIADRDAPAMAVRRALVAARNGTIAVSTDGGVHARAFALGFGQVPPVTDTDAPDLVVTLDPAGAHVAAQHAGAAVAGAPDWKGPADPPAVGAHYAVRRGRRRCSATGETSGSGSTTRPRWRGCST